MSPWAVLGLGAAAYLLFSGEEAEAETAPAAPAPRPVPPAPPELRPVPAPARPASSPDDGTDDETVLARMLVSEDRKHPTAWIVIGWITVQRARKAGKSLYQFVTGGQGWGHQQKGVNYAATLERPTAQSRQVAQQLLAGTVRPSWAIRKHLLGGWVERHQGLSDEGILAKQDEWHEGIYARVAGTQWFLYSSDSLKIAIPPYPNASAWLDAVPTVPALDVGVA